MAKIQINKFKFLIDLYKKSEDLQSVLQKAKDALANENYTYFEMMLKKATIMSAKSTMLLRQSCNDMIIDKNLKNELYCRLEQITNLDFQLLDNGIIMLQLPAIVNTRLLEDNRKDAFVNFLNDTFYRKIKTFILENNIKKFDKKICIHIINIIKTGTPKTWIPDIDNREYKNIVNLIKQFFVQVDTSEFISLYIDSEFGDSNKTIVYLVPDDNKKVSIAKEIKQNDCDNLIA